MVYSWIYVANFTDTMSEDTVKVHLELTGQFPIEKNMAKLHEVSFSGAKNAPVIPSLTASQEQIISANDSVH